MPPAQANASAFHLGALVRNHLEKGSPLGKMSRASLCENWMGSTEQQGGTAWRGHIAGDAFAGDTDEMDACPFYAENPSNGVSAFLFSWFGGERFCHLDELRLVDSWLVCGPVNDFCFRTWAAAPPKSILACIPLGFNIA